MREELPQWLTGIARKGHFELESGHHGELWLELDALFLRPAETKAFAAELARNFSALQVDAVCGPLIGGAFLGQLVALEMGVKFCHSERVLPRNDQSLYATAYRIPTGLRDEMRGRRVVIVDDVINAGSATRGTWADLEDCGAIPVAVGALLVLGEVGARFVEEKGVPLTKIYARSNAIWAPSECPQCVAKMPLSRELELPSR